MHAIAPKILLEARALHVARHLEAIAGILVCAAGAPVTTAAAFAAARLPAFVAPRLRRGRRRTRRRAGRTIEPWLVLPLRARTTRSVSPLLPGPPGLVTPLPPSSARLGPGLAETPSR